MSSQEDLRTGLRDVWRITLVEPIREGRLQPRGWPRGLAAILAAVMVVYVLLTLAAAFAVPLRQAGDLSVSPSTPHSLPTLAIPLLLTGLLLSFSLAHTAALHTSWWLRAVLFLTGASATFFFVGPAFDRPLQMAGSILSYLALLVFTIVRARRDYAWWEFWVVTLLVAVAALLPLAGGSTVSVSDLRPVGLAGALTSLQPLAMPAILVAGTAPAQIVVTGAVAASTRPVGNRLFWAGAAVVAVWFGVSLAQSSAELRPSGLLGVAACLIAVAAGLAGMLRRARQQHPAPPADYPETWGAWLYPIAIALVAMSLVILPFAVARSVLPMLGQGQSPVAMALDALWFGWIDNNPGVLWRALLGVVALVIAWRISRAGRLGEAGFLVSFAAAVLLDAAGLLPGGDFLLDRTPSGFAAVAGVAALAVGVWLAIRGRLTRERAAAVLTVLLLAVLYPHGDILSDPTSAVAVLSVPLVVLLGLTWRIFTDAGFTRGGSRHFPRPTRVLLYLANSLFAVTSIAFLALARGTGTDIDTSKWNNLAVTVLGDSLFVVALVAATWLAVRPPANAAGTTQEQASVT